ncbi:MAG TPA: transglycosylase, partial [Thauera aminoaromatica]|nr:transglycosylase [Thauera aminoaromatica]
MKKALVAALTAATFLAPAGAFAQIGGESGDGRIVAAREALRKGDRSTLERLAAVREAHPLDAYPRYWLLINRLARAEEPVPVAALQAFLAEEAGSNLAERLRADWLRRLARDGDWSGFLAVYADLRSPDAELRCNAWSARVLTGERSVFAELAREWDTLADADPTCDTPLRAAVDSGAVDEERVWWRIRRQIDTRKPEAALASLSLLPAGNAPAHADLAQAIRSPAPWLDRLQPNFAVSRAGRELALAALVRLAREDVSAARL